MSELDTFRSLTPPVLIAFFGAIGWLIKSLHGRLKDRTVEYEELRVKFNKEDDAHQKTKSELTKVQTKLELVEDAKKELETSIGTYQDLIRGLHNDITNYRIEFAKQMSELKVDFEAQLVKQKGDFEAQINALNAKHREFQENRDKEIAAKSQEIQRLEDENAKQANAHMLDIKKREAEHLKAIAEKDEEIREQQERYQMRFDNVEREYTELKERFDQLVKRLDTQPLRVEITES